MKAPVRCHLLIGPPASGKTTLAPRLAPLLAPRGPPALVLCTDRLRAEVFGDAAVQGAWSEIQERLAGGAGAAGGGRRAAGDRRCHPRPPALAAALHAELDRLDGRIRRAVNKELGRKNGKQLHACSRLLDLER